MPNNSTPALIFDSNPLSLKILEAMLQRLDIAPTVASQLSDVQQLCESRQFQVVFLDYQNLTIEMEHTLRALSQHVPFKPESVVTLSNELSAEEISLLQSNGVGQCLFRPIRFDDIENCLQTAGSNTAESASGSLSIIDINQLNDMADDWDEGFCELLREFLSDVREMFDQLRILSQSESYTEATRMAHSLKGSGANFGMVEFSKSMATAEQTLSHSKTLSDRFLNESNSLLEESIQLIQLELNKY